MNDVTETVMEMVSKELSVERGRLTPSTTFQELDADSLRIIELGLTMEERFGVNIPDETFRTFNCLGDLIEFVESRRAAAITPALAVAGSQGSR